MPSDVVIASGTEASVGKEGKKHGGSWYQAYIAEAEWDFFFFLRGGGVVEPLWRWDVGVLLTTVRNCWRNFLLIVFLHRKGLASLTTHVLSHRLPLFFPFIALMVLNNLYVSECTAPSVHVGRVRRQLGQSSGRTWFYPSLEAAGQLTFSCTLYSPQTDRVGFLKRSKASGAIRAPQKASFRPLCCTVSWRNVPEWLIAMLF